MRRRQAFPKISLPLILILAFFLLLSGCANRANEQSESGEQDALLKEVELQEVESQDEKQEIDLAKIKPNEAGRIMVLMYHGIKEPEAEWVRTPDNLRKDLQTLYDKGYRPLSLRDYVTGNITTEAGYTPVVLTFDDGWKNNFELFENEQGEKVLNPDCAVAILADFHEKHPDFPLEATFFVNNNTPFGQAEYLAEKLQYIVDKGMDIGNHTNTHVDFTATDALRIQKEIAGIVEMLGQYLPAYEVNTLALPSGSRPKDKELYPYLAQGSYEGISYKNIAILNVGWDPDKSPYHQDFNPLAIHRIRASEIQKYVQNVGMYDWLKRFDTGSLTRFVSDGDPATVTVPEEYLAQLAEDKVGHRVVKTYSIEK